MRLTLLISPSFIALLLALSINAVSVAATITSAGTGTWSSTAWPNTLRSGTIVTSASSTNVTGTGTSFTTQISPGNILKTSGNVAIGTVLSVNSATSITLTANAATSNSGIAYNVQGIGPGDAALVLGGTTITIDNAGAACSSLGSATTGPASPWALSFNAGALLAIAGTLTVGGASRSGSISMANGGTLACRALSVSNAGTWTPGAGTVELTAANTLPSTFFTSFNNLTISSGNTNTAAALTINGALSIANGGATSLTVPGFALTVNGTTTVGGGTSGSLLITSATGAKTFGGLVTVGTGAFFTNSGNAPVQFHGGITNSGTFAAGTGTQTFNTNDQTITGTFIIPGITVTGITLTNTGTLTVGTALAGTGTLAQDVNSTLNLNFTGLSSIGGLTANTAGNIVNYGFAGTQTVYATEYFDLLLSGSNVKTLQTGMTKIDGAFTLNGTSSATSVTGLTIGGDLTTATGTAWNAGAFTHHLQGNFFNSGTFNPGSGNIIFEGTSQQQISNNGTASFNNLTINNSGPGIQWLNSLSAALALSMLQGDIDLNGNTMTLGTSGASNGTLTYTSGTIIDGAGGGKFSRWFNTSVIPDGGVAGLFPVGTTTDYNPISVSAPVSAPTAAGTVSVAYNDLINNTAVNVTDGGSTIVVRKDLSWTLAAGSGITGGTYNLASAGTDFGTVGNVNDLRLMLANSVIGTAGVNGGTNANPQVRRTGLTSTNLSNAFYIGSTNASSSPLPITLLSFTAVVLGGQVKLDWETATEINNDHFTVQRRQIAGGWEDLTVVAGAGNSNINVRYTTFDKTPYPGASYYRLQQTDLDGKYTFSKIVSIYIGQSNTLTLSPNPVKHYLNVTTSGSGRLDISLFNVSGQKIEVPISLNNNYAQLDMSGLPAGIYHIRVIQNEMNEIRAILKN